jgi:hypothetical protein
VNLPSFPINGRPEIKRSSSFVTELRNDFPKEHSTSIFEVNRKPGHKPKPKSRSDLLDLELYSNNQRNPLGQISRRSFNLRKTQVDMKNYLNLKIMTLMK